MNLQQYWHQLQPREQRIVLGGSIATAILLLYALVFQPLMNHVAEQKQTLTQQAALSTWMQPRIQDIVRLRQQVGTRTLATPETLLTTVDSAVKSSNIAKSVTALSQNAPQRVTLHANSVPFDNLIDWLGDTTKNYGLRIQHFSVTPSGHNGLVHADIELSVAE
jgi:general secretion pathway protein M